MNDEKYQLLRLLAQGPVPVRLDVEQTAWVLNCAKHDIPTLIAAGLLKPLGDPSPTAQKHVSTLEILELAKDKKWLARATNTIHGHWQHKNGRRRNQCRGALGNPRLSGGIPAHQATDRQGSDEEDQNDHPARA